MKRISKKDYMEFVKKCENLINKNLEVLSIKTDELGLTYKCDSAAGGKLTIKLESFDMVGSVYSVFVQFEDKEKLYDLVGENYYKSNVFHDNKMNFMGFDEQQDYVYNKLYDIVACVVDNEPIE